MTGKAKDMEKTLLVLAAGMGSRYGGLKQMDPVGPGDEFILDYSVGDARAAGFSRVVFVIRADIEKDFREIVGARWEKRMKVEYALQDRGDVPAPFETPAERIKPWGTGHAVLAARRVIDGPFAVVNADDYYGADAMRRAAGFLDETAGDPGLFCMVAYRLDNTLSENAGVSRGICTVSPDGTLAKIEERPALSRCADGVIRDAGDAFAGDTPVSMNLFGFKRRFIDLLEDDFPRFLEKYGSLPKSEFQMPTALESFLRRGQARVKVLRTDSRWIGVTSRDDRPAVVEFFKTVPSPLS